MLKGKYWNLQPLLVLLTLIDTHEDQVKKKSSELYFSKENLCQIK